MVFCNFFLLQITRLFLHLVLFRSSQQNTHECGNYWFVLHVSKRQNVKEKLQISNRSTPKQCCKRAMKQIFIPLESEWKSDQNELLKTSVFSPQQLKEVTLLRNRVSLKKQLLHAILITLLFHFSHQPSCLRQDAHDRNSFCSCRRKNFTVIFTRLSRLNSSFLCVIWTSFDRTITLQSLAIFFSE